jgi:AcrR family transcriptional regulator
MPNMIDAITDAALDLLKREGLNGWTVEAVAQDAGCAKGLVNYHFGTKDTLLARVRERLEFDRRESRLAALDAAAGTAALDRLWQVLDAEVTTGAFGAWADLVRHFGPATSGTYRSDDLRLVAAVARALGLAESELMVFAPLIGPALDAFQLRLLQGEPPARAREGYDRLWVGVLG